MAEQETEEVKEKETKEEKEETEEKKDEYSRVKILSEKTYNPLYKSKEFLDKLEEDYINTQNYSETANRLNDRFKIKVTPATVKRIYTKRLAWKITNDKGANEFFEGSFTKMKERWQEAWDMVGDLIEQYKKLKKEIADEEDTKKALLMLRLTPTLLQIAQEIRKQLEFIQSQQEQIRIQQTTLIMSPLEINQQIGPILKMLIDEGRLSVNRDIPEFGLEKEKKK